MKTLSSIYSFLILPIDEIDPEKGKVLWLIRLRWIFLFLQFIIIIPLLLSNLVSFSEMSFYVGMCFMLAAFNLVMAAIWKKTKRPSSSVTFFSLLVDLVWFTVLFLFLIKVTPVNAQNIYFIHAALGAILLNSRKSIIFYSMIALCFFIVQLNQYDYFLRKEFITISFFNQIILLSVWIITRSVSKYVFSQREQLSQMKIYAEKMDRLRAIGALTAGFSHEFASPLNTIKLRLNRIARSESVKSEDIAATLEAVDNCEKIIRHMNQAQLDKRDFIFQSINLPNALEGIVESWKTDHPDAKLTISFSPSLPALVKMPIINFSQGFLNVLDNAYESNPDNSINVDITAEESKLLVCISDNGNGFSRDVLERFGEPFVTTKKEGTGLGLYSFLLFAQSIGGSVSVSNLNPKGAMVRFIAPLNT